MKVFISSLIAGFEPFREAVRSAVTTLRHEPVMAEDFGARPSSPQVACLSGLRDADAVVLVLGERYGAVQPSGLSATHEEYREAQGRKPVIAFVQEGISPEPRQEEFIIEVQAWKDGLFRGGFRNAEDLRAGVTRALHDYDLARAIGPVNAEELVERAVALLGREDRQGHGSPTLSLAIAGGPRQRILRPVEIEAPELSEDLNQAALFGETRIFDRTKGVDTAMEGSALSLRQEREGHVQLNEEGAVLIQLPVVQPTRRGTSSYSGFPALIQENVQQRIGSALTYATWLLERVDPIQRLTHVAIAARIDAAEHMAWRTQAEQDASPTSGSMGMGLSRERAPVQICQPRAALRLNRTHLVEDLLVPLRRIWKTG